MDFGVYDAGNGNGMGLVSVETVSGADRTGWTRKKGVYRESNPGPLAPKARIIPLDHKPWLLASAAKFTPIYTITPPLPPTTI